MKPSNTVRKIKSKVLVEIDEDTILQLAMAIARKRRDEITTQLKALEVDLAALEARQAEAGPPDPAIESALTKEYGPRVKEKCGKSN